MADKKRKNINQEKKIEPSTISYSLIADKKITAETSLKQFSHFFRSDLCPPTSTIVKCTLPTEKWVSCIPEVALK